MKKIRQKIAIKDLISIIEWQRELHEDLLDDLLDKEEEIARLKLELTANKIADELFKKRF